MHTILEVLYHNMWPGLGKLTMYVYVQELESLLLTNFIATLVHYPETAT